MLEYTQVSFLLDLKSDGLFLTLLFSSLGIVFLSVGLSIFLVATDSMKSSGYKALSVYCMFTITILSMPIFHSFLAAVICLNDNYIHNYECYKG